MKKPWPKALLMLLLISFLSCSSDDSVDPGLNCAENEDIFISESNSIILAEMEIAKLTDDWRAVNDLSDATGSGYIRWEGEDQFGNPGSGLITFKLNVSNPGTYRFIWRSAVTEGDNPTESNDSWLRFADADDFYGEKNNGSIVYPNGTGKSPNPEGASRDGWFKIYRSGNPLSFKWQARTSDNDAHDIFVVFNEPGVYTMEVSGRSKGHAIDKFVLYQEDVYSQDEATESTDLSELSCQ